MRALLLLPALFVLSTGLSRADSSDDDQLDQKLTKLRTVVSALQLKSVNSDAPQAQEMASRGQVISGYLSEVSSYQQQGNYEQIIRSGRRLLRQDLPPEIKTALTDLLASIEKLRDARMKEVSEKGEALLTRIADTAWKAKDVTDLEPLRDDIQDLREKVQSDSSSMARKWQNRLSYAENFLNRWAEYLTASADGDARTQINILRDLRRDSSSRLLVSRIPADQFKKKQADLQAALVHDLTGRLNVAQTALLQARTAGEADKVGDEIAEIQNDSDSGVTGRAFYNRINRLQNAVEYWSRVLACEEGGDYDGALQALRNLMSNSQGAVFPSDAINATLKRLLHEAAQAPEKAKNGPVMTMLAEQMERLKTPDQVGETLKAVEMVQRYSFGSSQDLSLLQNDLQALATVQQALVDKRYGTAFDPPQEQRNYAWQGQVKGLRNQVTIQAINQLYGNPDPATFKGTAVEAFDAAFKGATGKNDWAQALEILENKDRFINGTCGRTTRPAEIGAIRAYVEGVNLEQAEQWPDAVLAFRTVLRQDTPSVPRAQALEHLHKIVKDHPEAAAAK